MILIFNSLRSFKTVGLFVRIHPGRFSVNCDTDAKLGPYLSFRNIVTIIQDIFWWKL